MFGTKSNAAFSYVKQAAAMLDLTGRKICIVGGTDGIGRAVARLAASRGAEVTVVGRTFRDAGTDRISFTACDLSRLQGAYKLGSALPTHFDVLMMTNGILAKPKRQETPEGLEEDTAVSFLSRLAMLRSFMPRVAAAKGAETKQPLRIFVMGFPGAGQAGVLGDLNAEKSYDALAVHMNTVAGNEALVLHGNEAWGKGADGGRGWVADVFGLNPGLIKTSIRKNYLGTGLFAGFVEWIIGMTCQSTDKYAEGILPLLFAPDISGRGGAMFDSRGNAILPTLALTKERVAALMKESEALVDRGLAFKAPALGLSTLCQLV